ncbi:hypothetical protein M0R45_019863 [Rubus argutus]|uniref:FAR1 domain-containing protein n=1 Tax=Rubus argutus TaxID=59490 RepID=A0AAW1X945_RUBAR
MEESHSNPGEYEHNNCGSLPTDVRQEDLSIQTGCNEAYTDDGHDEATYCLHYKGKKYEDLVLEDLEGVEFKSIDEVDQFYSHYSLATSFSVRKHKTDKNSEQNFRRRQLLCSRAGERRTYASKKQKFSSDRDNWREDINCQSKTQKKCSTVSQSH